MNSLQRDTEAQNLLPAYGPDEKGVEYEAGRIAGQDFTNVQFNLVFPQDANGKGVRLGKDADGEAFYSLVGTSRKTYVDFSYNAEKYPDIPFVGVNTSKTAIKDNPQDLMEMYLVADEGMLTGDYELAFHTLKYTAYTDEKIQNLDGGVVCKIHVEGATGVDEINAAKAVSSVKYFNAAGMASDNAFDGVNIVVTKYADGTQSVAKVVK